MLTECNPDSAGFAMLGNRKVTATFDGGAITSNAGALLLREVDLAMGLSRQVAACFRDGRRQDRIEHAAGTLVAQRIHGIALGYEDLNDHDELRHDPVPLYIFCGRDLLLAKLRPANIDASAGAKDEIAWIVAQIRRQKRLTCLPL
jgi:hypothetical protein